MGACLQGVDVALRAQESVHARLVTALPVIALNQQTLPPPPPPAVIVFGATGSVGGAVCKMLKAGHLGLHGIKVVAVGNKADECKELESSLGIHTMCRDAADAKAVKEVFDMHKHEGVLGVSRRMDCCAQGRGRGGAFYSAVPRRSSLLPCAITLQHTKHNQTKTKGRRHDRRLLLQAFSRLDG
jgi:NADPH:quinone reductase-like Zn-dependent oxidoreductase